MQNVAYYNNQPNTMNTMNPLSRANEQGYNPTYAAMAPSVASEIKPSEVEVFSNVPAFYGSDVYIAKQGVVVGLKEKRYIRLRWGDGTKGNKARWVGFAPSDWKKGRPLDSDPELLGFYIKPTLCVRSNKNKQNVGWVTLSIDCDRRAVKATIDGWTLGKVFIPTWLIGRVMRPVAIAETGTPVEFNLKTEEGCEKVIRSGFKKWATIQNKQLELLQCQFLHTNFEHNESPDRCRILSERAEILGIQLHVEFDADSNVKRIIDCDEGYISYEAVDMEFTKPGHEVLPLVINDRHAYRVKGQNLWNLFWSDNKSPLDYLSERITALTRVIYEAKMRHDPQLYKNATTKLSHMRHILYFLAKGVSVVEDANTRVEWFISNTDFSGTHKNFTPDLGRLLTCLAVSDYQWEDVAIPFFTEALDRALNAAIQNNPRITWHGKDASDFEELLEALLITDGALSETVLQVRLLNEIFKPCRQDLDNLSVDRLSAEEICCGLAGLGDEFQILDYAHPSKKDEIKKCLIKREYADEFTDEQWLKIEAALDNKQRFRGIIARSRVVAECHGTGGLPTDKWYKCIDEAIELTKTLESFEELLDAFGLAYPGDEKMQAILTKSVAMSQQKGYITLAEPVDAEGLLSSRVVLELNEECLQRLERQEAEPRVFEAEVLPKPENEDLEERIVVEGDAHSTSTAEHSMVAMLDPLDNRPPFVGEPSHTESNHSEGRERTAAQIIAGAYQQQNLQQPIPGGVAYQQGMNPSLVHPKITPGYQSPTPPSSHAQMLAYQQATMRAHPGYAQPMPTTTPGYQSPTPTLPGLNARQVSGGSVASNYSVGYGGDDLMSSTLNEQDKALLRVNIPGYPGQTRYYTSSSAPPHDMEVPYVVQYVPVHVM